MLDWSLAVLAVVYKQVSFEAIQEFRQGGASKSGVQRSPGASVGDFEGAAGNDFLFQHLREVVIDHQNGIFTGTNNNVENLGGRPPMTLEAFITKHRAADAVLNAARFCEHLRSFGDQFG